MPENIEISFKTIEKPLKLKSNKAKRFKSNNPKRGLFSDQYKSEGLKATSEERTALQMHSAGWEFLPPYQRQC